MSERAIAIEQLAPGSLEATDNTAAYGPVLMSRVSSNLPVSIRVMGLLGWASYVLPEPARPVYCSGIRCGPEHCLVSGNSADLELICRAPAEVIVCRIGARQGAPTPLQRGTCRLAGNAAELSYMRAIVSSLRSPLAEHKVTFTDLRDSLAALSPASDAAEGPSGHRRAMSSGRAATSTPI